MRDGYELDWVQSVGLGAGNVQIKDDNPYLPIGEITTELIEAELSALTSTVALMQHLLPHFKAQKSSRIVVVSSMSAVRSFASGSLHMAAKGALSRFVNAAMIELAPQNIFVTDVRPGGVDTGLYDSEIVQKTIRLIASSYGYDWSGDRISLMPPRAVGKAILTALASEGHIPSINLVAQGQWPHEGS